VGCLHRVGADWHPVCVVEELWLGEAVSGSALSANGPELCRAGQDARGRDECGYGAAA